MNDRELLELAAKAAGIPGRYHNEWAAIAREDLHDSFGRSEPWRPLNDDGDAFRLSAHLGLVVEFDGRGIVARTVPGSGRQIMCSDMSDTDSDHLPKLRRTIVRAAAEMGEQL